MKILIISWFFPPWNESASGRPSSWATAFAELGHEVTVLTCKKDDAFHGNLTLPCVDHPNVEVVETPLRFTRTPVGKGASWAVTSIGTARSLAKDKDLVISTFMPWFVHLLGKAAKSANSNIFWCADFRDLWHDFDYMTDAYPLKKRISRVSEKHIVRTANLITTVSPPLALKLSNTHPHLPCKTIYNGFLKADWKEKVEASRLKDRALEGSPFTILYTGTIYPRGFHNPEPIYRVLSRRKKERLRKVKLLFYGHCRKLPLLKELALKYDVEDMITVSDEFLTRDACIALQHDVDLLLHLSWTNPKMDGVLSGKVFEYMASGVPLLSIGAQADTAIGRLLNDSGTGVCVGLSDEEVYAVIAQMADRNEYPVWFKPARDKIQQFSRECQAAKLLEMVNEIGSGQSNSSHEQSVNSRERLGDMPF